MQCIKIEPGKEPELCEIDNKLKALQAAVADDYEQEDEDEEVDDSDV